MRDPHDYRAAGAAVVAEDAERDVLVRVRAAQTQRVVGWLKRDHGDEEEHQKLQRCGHAVQYEV